MKWIVQAGGLHHANSLCQKPHTNRFAGESACATSMDQLFAAPSGAGFSLPRLLPQAVKLKPSDNIVAACEDLRD
jgi:hypothetical protein